MEGSKQNILLRYLRYAKPYRLMIGVVIIAGICKFTIPLVPAYITRLILDRIILNQDQVPYDQRLDLLWFFAAVLLAAAVLEGVAIFVRGFLTIKASSGVAFDLRQNLWRHLQRLSLNFHQSRPTGSILSRLMSDISVAQQMINQGIINVCMDFSSGVIAIVILFYIDWRLTLIVLSILPFYGMLYRKINPRLRAASHDVQEQTSLMSGSAVERLAGIAVVQSFAQEEQEQRRFDEQASELRHRFVRRGWLHQWLDSISHWLVSIASGGVWIFGAYIVMKGDMTPGAILQFTGTALILYMPIRRLSQINITFQNSMAAIERVFAIMDFVPEVLQRPGVEKRSPTEGAISFRDVSFHYSDGPDVLKNVSFDVKSGERVAIVGESGAGKSTLVTLMSRLYDVTGGVISIDNIDLRDYPLKNLRRNIGIVLQDTILFSGSIRENLRYGRKEASHTEIVEAAKVANIHSFIEKLPDGYETLIGERGLTLSGGQRQRVSLARTVLQDPKILILDEATSSLDSESENLITEALQHVMVGRTCLIIAHRLSTILNADRILVFREGQVVQSGSHENLMAAEGYYRHLFEQQFKPLQNLVGDKGNRKLPKR